MAFTVDLRDYTELILYIISLDCAYSSQYGEKKTTLDKNEDISN